METSISNGFQTMRKPPCDMDATWIENHTLWNSANNKGTNFGEQAKNVLAYPCEQPHINEVPSV